MKELHASSPTVKSKPLMTQLNDTTKKYSRQDSDVTCSCTTVTLLYWYIFLHTKPRRITTIVIVKHYNIRHHLLPILSITQTDVQQIYISTPVISLLPYIQAYRLILSPILQPRTDMVVYIIYIYIHIIHKETSLYLLPTLNFGQLSSTKNSLRNPNPKTLIQTP